MDPTLAVSITYSIIGIAPAIAILLLYKSAKPKYFGLLLFGFMLIILGTIIIGFSTGFISIMEDWLLKQNNPELIADGKEAVLNLKVWAYVFPGVTIAIGANLLSEFLLRRNNEVNS